MNDSVRKIAKNDVDTSNYYMSASDFKTKHLSSNDFLIMHVNTRNLSKIFSDLKELLVDISKKSDIPVLAISETKLKDGQQYNYNVELEQCWNESTH